MSKYVKTQHVFICECIHIIILKSYIMNILFMYMYMMYRRVDNTFVLVCVISDRFRTLHWRKTTTLLQSVSEWVEFYFILHIGFAACSHAIFLMRAPMLYIFFIIVFSTSYVYYNMWAAIKWLMMHDEFAWHSK